MSFFLRIVMLISFLALAACSSDSETEDVSDAPKTIGGSNEIKDANLSDDDGLSDLLSEEDEESSEEEDVEGAEVPVTANELVPTKEEEVEEETAEAPITANELVSAEEEEVEEETAEAPITANELAPTKEEESSEEEVSTGFYKEDEGDSSPQTATRRERREEEKRRVEVKPKVSRAFYKYIPTFLSSISNFSGLMEKYRSSTKSKKASSSRSTEVLGLFALHYYMNTLISEGHSGDYSELNWSSSYVEALYEVEAMKEGVDSGKIRARYKGLIDSSTKDYIKESRYLLTSVGMGDVSFESDEEKENFLDHLEKAQVYGVVSAVRSYLQVATSMGKVGISDGQVGNSMAQFFREVSDKVEGMTFGGKHRDKVLFEELLKILSRADGAANLPYANIHSDIVGLQFILQSELASYDSDVVDFVRDKVEPKMNSRAFFGGDSASFYEGRFKNTIKWITSIKDYVMNLITD